MTVIQLIFYMFSAVAIGSGVLMIVSRNPVHGVLALVVTFFSCAGLWMLLHAEFLSLILVLVYVGAVMTLFLFVVMMLNINVTTMRSAMVKYLPLGILIVLMIVAMLAMVLDSKQFGLIAMPAPPLAGADYNNIQALGNVLYTEFVYPFEIAAVILLTAIVAAISLTHRQATRRKAQSVSAQIAVRREDRVRLVKMPTAKYNTPPAGES